MAETIACGKPPGQETPDKVWREHITIDRANEFFDADELSKQIGHDSDSWAAAILKELIDNGLDAAESIGAEPEITITIKPDSVRVTDNGAGIPPEVVTGSLDYRTRTTDKLQYCAPTRGRQGNALKTTWAAPFVATGGGSVVVEAQGVRHTVTIATDPLAASPKIHHVRGSSSVKTGSIFELRWKEVARSLTRQKWSHFYGEYTTEEDWLAGDMRDSDVLIKAFSLFNPHASFTLSHLKQPLLDIRPRRADWRKWRADQPSPVTWYSLRQFTDLIATFIRLDESAERLPRSIREFIGTFKGMTGTQKPKAVCESAEITAKTIRDLFNKSRSADATQIKRLYEAMIATTDAPEAKKLGAIGKEAFIDGLRQFGTDGGEKYKVAMGTTGGLPWILEVGFAVSDDAEATRVVAAGVNWSPTLRIPFDGLSNALAIGRVDSHDPVVLGIHLAYPSASSTDRGKTRYSLPDEITEAMREMVAAVAKDWRKEKVKDDRSDKRMEKAALDAVRNRSRTEKQVIKEATYSVMAESYRQAAGTLGIAAARQVMYAARPKVLAITGGKSWKDSKYFTQTLLPNYIAERPEETANWDVVFDDRGHFREPHTKSTIGIGTIAVRGYIQAWAADTPKEKLGFRLPTEFPTSGPRNRFGAALFVEKEGFNTLLERARIAETYDVAIMSTKGMTVTAARSLIERLSENGVTIFALHDFDKSGLSILHSMKSNNRRYAFKTAPRVIDLGLRLDDVKALSLTSEPVEYLTRKDPKDCLRGYGASGDECEFLAGKKVSEKKYAGERVELNALSSDQLIALIRRKFAEHGVAKIVPDAATLAVAYQRAVRLAVANRAVAKVIQKAQESVVSVPNKLADRVADLLKKSPEIPWDKAIEKLAEETSK